MKIIDVQQGSPEWFRARLGIPTASSFDQIITPKTGQLSKSSLKYAYKLLAERLLKAPTDTVEGQQWMERGKELEPAAVRQYEFVNEVETTPIGFITTDDGLAGASPDRIVKGKAVGIEIKCPAPHTHLAYLLSGVADEYRPQVQGQLYVCEFERVDLYSYHPRMPAAMIRTPRDEPYIVLVKAALAGFNDQLFELFERAISFGIFQAFEEAVTPTDLDHAQKMDAAFREDFGLPPIMAANPAGNP